MAVPVIKFPAQYESYRGIVLFMVTLLLANIVWKLSIAGDDAVNTTSVVTLWGMNVSMPFDLMASNVAKSVSAILNVCGTHVTVSDENVIRHDNGHAVRIIWACSGLKQMYIFFCIFLCSRGPWKKKLYIIPLGILLVHLTNVLRIVIIAASVKNHHEWFHFLHEYLTKYGFYVIIFLIWVVWEEIIVPQKSSE